MTKFIKLSNKLINTSFINTISIFPKKYLLNINENNISGFGYVLAGTGFFNWNNNYNSTIQICAETNPDDYKIIDEWIKNIN